MNKAASGSRKFDDKNMNFNVNNQGYFSESETDDSEMVKLNNGSEENDDFIHPPARKQARIQNKGKTGNVMHTQNKFGILEDHEIMETNENTSQPNQTATKKHWIPPLVIQNQIVNYKVFNEQIIPTLGHRNFRIHYRNSGRKIITQNTHDRQKLMTDFEKSNIFFHTCTPNENKLKKIVLKGAPQMDKRN